MFRGYNLKQKEVVNIKTAERLGRISDVEISESTGNIEAIIVPRKGCCLARLFGGGELVIPWSAIEVVGEDLVLVRFFDIHKGETQMRCPYCGFAESKVIDSRPTEESNSIRRRRECLKCQKRFTTYEKLEAISLAVIKKDQSRQQYDRGKVLKGIITACEKRPISLSQMEQIEDDIESELYQSMTREIESTAIGEKVMKKLKKLDEVAYVRFASVYKSFDDIDTFMAELQGLIDDKKD